MEEISKLLNVHKGPREPRQEYREKIEGNQIIRGWNAFLQGKGPDESGFKTGTTFDDLFKSGYDEARLFLTGESTPIHNKDLLERKIPPCTRTISECMQQLGEVDIG